MRFMRIYWVGLVVGFLFSLGIEAGASAQANVPVEISPNQLTISGFQGDQEERTLLLRPLPGGITVQITPSDLNRIDKLDVLPASAIQPQLTDGAESENGLLSVPLDVDLGGASNGLFNGNLLVRYGNEEPFFEQVIPLTVQIKAWWPVPLIILVLGVILGMGLTNYRQSGRQRDEILVGLGQVSTQIEADTELSKAFRQRIDANLIDVQTAFRSEDWETAKAKLDQAALIFDKWRKDRDNWMAQLAYHETLIAQLEDGTQPNQNARYMRDLDRGLAEAGHSTPEFENSSAFRKRLDQLAGYINQYFALRGQLENLESTVSRLGFKGEVHQRKAQQLGDDLDNLSPIEDAKFSAAYKALQAEVENLDQEVAVALEKHLESAPGVRGGGALGLPQGSSILQVLLNPPPMIQEWATGQQSEGAQSRLKIFQWATYIIAVTLLAGTGFNELYIENATFGQNLWGDYFTLFAWGFGAEATRSAITDLVRNWDLPGAG